MRQSSEDCCCFFNPKPLHVTAAFQMVQPVFILRDTRHSPSSGSRWMAPIADAAIHSSSSFGVRCSPGRHSGQRTD
jgi:hypothetical protein